MGIKLFKKLRKIDLFRVSFSFKYMNKEKYATSIGGFVTFIFSGALIWIFVINFIPFIKKKNFNLQDYIVNTHETEEINLKDSPTAFAIGFDCPVDSRTQIKAEDLFDLNVSFITYTKDNKGNRNKAIGKIETHNCNENDFHNEHNDSFDFLKIKNLQCLNEKKEKLGGIYTDKKFTYYEFSLMAKENTTEHYKKIDDYLIENDCKLQFYYTDLTLNLSNYKEPIKSFINSLFLQINPTLFLKMNVFFMNYHLNNDTTFIPIKSGNKEEDPLLNTGFSRAEQYFLYKGTDRFSKKPDSFHKYANLYIRVDNKKIEINRKYQNLLEFYADNSSLLLSIFAILNFLFSKYNTFKANESISKRLFYNDKNEKKFILKLIEKENRQTQSSMRINQFNSQTIYNCDTDKHLKKIKNENYIKKKQLTFKCLKKYIPNFSSLFYCCDKEKEKWNDEANNILNKKLDIYFYMKTMILLEIMYQKLVDDNIKKEINNYSRFVQFIKDIEENKLKDFYEYSNGLNPDEVLNDEERNENLNTNTNIFKN